MIRKFARFNIYLAAVLALALVAGCESMGKEKKKDKAYMDLHQEATAPGSDTENVPIMRDQPVYVTVDKEPFLDSEDIAEAKVLEDLGGFVLQVRFNWRGQQVFGGVTTANRGKRIAVHCIFKNGKKNESRWIASPVINSPIVNGIFTFTPDTTRAEADLIAKGLNNAAADLKKKDEF